MIETKLPTRSLRAKFVSLLIVASISVGLSTAFAYAQSVGASGLPLPRYVSLGSNKINVRHGPGQKYDIAWIFLQSGLPVEIIQEFEPWRKVRDSEGSEGWIHKTLLSGRRTALVTPWLGTDTNSPTTIYSRSDQSAPRKAMLQPGVLLSVDKCEESWCYVSGSYKPNQDSDRKDNFAGWIYQSTLWGVYQNETFD